jgi:tRNA 2-selenouridine synthase
MWAVAVRSDSMRLASQLEPADVYPAGARVPAVQLLDVRAPIEFARCHLPGSRSLPILTDSERASVGTCYREHGQDAAIALGMSLTAPHRQARVLAWRQAVAETRGEAAFVCWRGGQRSGIAQQWLADENVPRVQGGTKALRRFLMAQLEQHFEASQAVVISGLTGCGKTEVLHQLAEVVPADVLALDLEGLANHRGSAFGGLPDGQPAQQTFENHLAATVQLSAPRLMLLEDEARNVGRLELPVYVWAKTKQSPVVMVEATHAERIARIAREYVFEPTTASSRAVVLASLQCNLNKLAKRLGGVRQRECLEALAHADEEQRWHTVAAHAPWIDILLVHYYDKFYESAMTRLARPVLFRGCAAEVVQWCRRSGLQV